MKNFYELLAEKTRLRPSHPCVVEDEAALSYGEFLRETDRLSGRLPAKPGDAVLILADTFTRQAAAFFAAQKIGARPVLLHHGLAPQEEAAIFKERGLQGFWRVAAEGERYEAQDAPRRFIDAEDCLGVLTSGSTGTPKVMYRTYRSWAEFFPVQNEVFGVDENARLFLHGSLSFTGNLNAFLAVLFAGGTTVTSAKLRVRSWASLLRARRANVLYLVPAKLRLLAAEKEPFAGVRSLFTGSQTVGDKLLARLARLLPNARIVLYYGASELNYITYTVLDADAPRDPENLGRPFPGIGLSVRDGKIYVDTAYHVSGTKTPFTVGDAGYLNDAGELIFEGRGDAYINKGGFKISAARIENCLRELPGVAAAVVLPYADEARGEELAAFLVREPDANEAEIRRALPKALKPVEMPKQTVFLEEIPLNDRGKPDKKRLWEMAERGTN
ncbi:MAG: AMP-binding protein [Schwartzia sp.]|nr:AMP-binding protein [Schwartzia sp. (in: firmicutes)]